MFRNYFIIAWRKLLKNKAFSVINITGLAIGVFSCVTIYLFVAHELSYDQFHTYSKDIYRVNMATKWGDQEGKRPTTPPPVAGLLMQQIPQVMAATRIYPTPTDIVFYQDKAFQEKRILATDTNFFEVFSFKLVEGNAKTALQQPNTVIITENIVRKYFGENNQAIGKLLQIGKQKAVFKVTGVIEEAPDNSHFQFDFLTSINSYENVKFFHWSWIWTQLVTYVRLKPNSNPSHFTAALDRMVETYAPAAFQRLGFPYDQFKAGNNYWKIYLQPLNKVWLYSQDIGNVLGDQGNIQFVRVSISVGFFILILACINFINLQTAGAIGRAREVGVRKAIGTSKSQLVYQFLFESLLICVLAVVLGLTWVQLFTSQFGWMQDRSFSLNDLGVGNILLVGLIFTGLISVLAGFYPAIYLSSFDTVKALRGHLKHGKAAKTVRNSLVVFQFCISVSMILITLVVARQLQFLKEKDTGFDKDHLVVVQQADRLGNNKSYFQHQLEQMPGVAQVSYSAYTFPNFQRFEDTYQPKESSVREATLISLVADHQFISTLGLQLNAGRNFDKNNAGDKYSVIISELAARHLGWNDPIGKELVYPGFPGDSRTFTVIGVVNNFHQLPVNFNLEPFILFLPESGHPTDEAAYFMVRMKGDIQENLALLEKAWKRTANGWPFQYTFVDDSFRAAYQAYEDIQSLFLFFSALAICVSCLGLLCLSVYSTSLRTKEIGIRKVLGASVSGIILLLNREFIGLILFAFLAGSAAGALLVQSWLENFAYHINITFVDILLPGIIVLIIALLTVSYISLKAAKANPVKALKYE